MINLRVSQLKIGIFWSTEKATNFKKYYNR